jgi:3-methyl-2-oxobutanoate hydroxymethyltransferase
MLMETNCDCIKLEGGVVMAPTIKRMVEMGIPVRPYRNDTAVRHLFRRLQSSGGTPESAKN